MRATLASALSNDCSCRGESHAKPDRALDRRPQARVQQHRHLRIEQAAIQSQRGDRSRQPRIATSRVGFLGDLRPQRRQVIEARVRSSPRPRLERWLARTGRVNLRVRRVLVDDPHLR